MNNTTIQLNPFSLMMEPELVLQAMERSEQLQGLRRQRMRLLDKPLIPHAKKATAVFDAEIEAEDLDDVHVTSDAADSRLFN